MGVREDLLRIAGGDRRIEDALDAALNLTMHPTFFSIGSLERVGEETDPQRRRLLQLGEERLGGFTSPELVAQREAAEADIDRQAETLLRSARGANIASGRQGAVQAAALPAISRETLGQKRNLERDLLAANAALQNERFRDLSDLNLASDQQDFTRRAFNLGQLEKEKAAQLGLIFGSGQFGAGQSAQESAEKIAREQLKAGIGGGSVFSSSGGGSFLSPAGTSEGIRFNKNPNTTNFKPRF